MRQLEKVGPGCWSYRGYTITDDGYAGRYGYFANDFGQPADHLCGEVDMLGEALEAIDELIADEEDE